MSLLLTNLWDHASEASDIIDPKFTSNDSNPNDLVDVHSNSKTSPAADADRAESGRTRAGPGVGAEDDAAVVADPDDGGPHPVLPGGGGLAGDGWGARESGVHGGAAVAKP
jgi:hypothetical protein